MKTESQKSDKELKCKCGIKLGDWLDSDKDRLYFMGPKSQNYTASFNHIEIVCRCGKRYEYKSKVMDDLYKATSDSDLLDIAKIAKFKGFGLERKTFLQVDPRHEKAIREKFSPIEERIYRVVESKGWKSSDEIDFDMLSKEAKISEELARNSVLSILTKRNDIMVELGFAGKLDTKN